MVGQTSKSILITGGMGFIGSNFVRLLHTKQPDWNLIVLDKLTYAGNPENLKDLIDEGGCTFIHGDICNQKDVDPIVPEVDYIINFAAETHVDRSIHYAGDFVTTDVYGTFILLEAARNHGISKFIQISTDEVYGDAPGRPSVEDDALMPKSPYAASKTGADRLSYSYYKTYGLPVVITRCVNNYGPRQYPEKLIPLFITNIIENKELPVYGSGTNTREWIHADDHSRAIISLLEEEGNEGEVFNIGTGVELSVLEIVDKIIEIIGRGQDLIRHVEDRLGHVQRHAVDSSKIKVHVGWTPELNFDKAMEHTVNWYLDNEDWWRPLKSGEFKEYYQKQYGK